MLYRFSLRGVQPPETFRKAKYVIRKVSKHSLLAYVPLVLKTALSFRHIKKNSTVPVACYMRSFLSFLLTRRTTT